MDYIVTKSKYCTGLQCLKLLWKEVNAEDEIPEIDPATELLFRQGREVNEAAREQFPEGTLIDYSPWDTVVDRTRQAIGDGAPVVFEGTFIHNDTMVRVDVLRKVGDDLFDIIEVKMSTKVKDEHIPDVAVQRYVLEGAGLGINKAHLMHLNRDHVHPDQGELFEIEDCTDEVMGHLPEVAGKIKAQKEILKESEPPKMDIGPHCSDPYDCPLVDECWEDIPEISVLNIPRLRWAKRWDLFDNGTISIEELPAGYSLNAAQEKFVQSALTHEPIRDKAAIKQKLDRLKEPLYFMDFETMNWAMPRYEGCNPYYQVPFQWSLHILQDGELEHHEFLVDGPEDPRKEFTQSLIENIGKEGPVIVYHQSFEKSILNKMAVAFPEREQQIRAIISRLWDLEDIFKYHYTDARFLGSTSIKNVLPVVVPNLSYDDLEISEGGEAQVAYIEMIESEEEEEMKRLRKALLEYCGMDTLAMVELYRRLREVCN